MRIPHHCWHPSRAHVPQSCNWRGCGGLIIVIAAICLISTAFSQCNNTNKTTNNNSSYDSNPTYSVTYSSSEINTSSQDDLLTSSDSHLGYANAIDSRYISSDTNITVKNG